MTARERRSYCVYIMGSLSGTLYIGFTGNLHKRIFQHKFHQMESFTNKYDVERLVYWASYDNVHLALARGEAVKGMVQGEEDCADRVAESALVGRGQGVVSMDGEP
jgi:predicted GIY-YIG superfamily endonuclease